MATSSTSRRPQSPIAFTQTPEDLIRMTQGTIETSKQTINEILNIQHANISFVTVVLPFAQDENNRINIQALTDVFQHMSPYSALRDASSKAESLWAAYDLELNSRSDLHLLFCIVKDLQEELDPELKYYLDQKLANQTRHGAALPKGSPQERFKTISHRIHELTTECQENLRGSSGGMWCSLEELSGLPGEFLDTLKTGESGSENHEKLWVTFKRNHLNLCLKYCRNSNTRKRAFIGNENKCLQNVSVFKELITSRAELAETLGYASFADYKSQDKMMGVESTKSFLEELKHSIAPHAEIEMKQMGEFKKKHLLASEEKQEVENVYLWDSDYYTRLIQESQRDFDEVAFSEYFSLDETVRQLLEIFEEIFGLQIRTLNFEDTEQNDVDGLGPFVEKMTWHEDVQAFSVWNERPLGNEFLGYLYLDLLQREGKSDSPCNVTFQTAIRGFDLANNRRHYPSTAVLASFSHPTSAKPTLLIHRQLLTLFHELGHAVHYLLGRTRFASTYGTSTSHDFVEIPSKMLENWCWDPSTLLRLSKHYTYLSPAFLATWEIEHQGLMAPKEKAGKELLKNLVWGRARNLAFVTLKQIWLAEYDITIHSIKSSKEMESIDLSETYNRLRYDITGLHGPEMDENKRDNWGSGQTRFSHMFGFYAAGYYCYALASVLSADLFETNFKKDLMSQKEGRRYRELVLGRGGSRCAMEFLEEYLGRKPGSDSFATSFQQ